MARRNRKPWGKDPQRMRSLEHYKRNPACLPLGRRVRIWSNEHRAYWRPGGCGYTIQRGEAGTWVSQDAFAETRGCDADKAIWFEFVEQGDTGEEARHERHWHEDMGDVLWWKFPIVEPPYVGSPIASDWPGYHTHFTPLPPMPHRPKRGSRNA